MTIKDEIWGEWHLEDPLIIELVNSHPIQRLKRINNDGANRYLYEVGNPTRYKHSMGVLYLTTKFSARREDYIMAILHDVAHAAFSHVVDFVFDKGDTQDFHEDVKKQLIDESEIKGILYKYGYRSEDFYEKERYPIVGNGKGQLNADRIDYFMRDAYGIGLLESSFAKLFIEDLHFDQTTQEFFFTNQRIAASFAVICLNTSVLAYSSANAIGSTYLLSSALKRALEINLIQSEDLMQTDEEIMNKLINSSDSQIRGFISRLNRSTRFEFCSVDEAEYSTKNKFRYVDPKIKIAEGEIKNVSTLVSNFESYIKQLENDLSLVSIRERKS